MNHPANAGSRESLGAVQSLLQSQAKTAGLSANLSAFAHTGTLAERLSAAPFLMAPMAGVSNAAWRIMARAGGAPLAYSEMVSVAGLHYQSQRTWELVVPHGVEPDLAVQLFGSQPVLFREACERVASTLGSKLALIDVNMACPVPKVVRKGEGSALLGDIPRAQAIIKACVQGLLGANAQVPVTAKIRLGQTPAAFLAPDVARALEDAGASAVGVHGRFASELYRGQSRDEAIAQVVKAVEIPVIGSGDVLSANRALELKERTGCTAVFVARGNYGNPWIFQDARDLLRGKTPKTHTLEERLEAWRLHVRLLDAMGAPLARARSFSCEYCKGLPQASRWRERIMGCRSLSDYLTLIDAIQTFANNFGVGSVREGAEEEGSGVHGASQHSF